LKHTRHAALKCFLAVFAHHVHIYFYKQKKKKKDGQREPKQPDSQQIIILIYQLDDWLNIIMKVNLTITTIMQYTRLSTRPDMHWWTRESIKRPRLTKHSITMATWQFQLPCCCRT